MGDASFFRFQAHRPEDHTVVQVTFRPWHSSRLVFVVNFRELRADVLCGLALRHARSFLQSAEMFRRAKTQLSRAVMQAIHCAASDAPFVYHEPSLSTLLSWPMILRRQFAQLELLVAESVHQHVYQYDKLLAYHHAAELFVGLSRPFAPSDGFDVPLCERGTGGFIPTVGRAADVSSTMRQLHEPLLELLLQILLDEYDLVVICLSFASP